MIKIGLSAAFMFVVFLLPSPDGQKVAFLPKVVTADVIDFKKKPDRISHATTKQPAVYCGVTLC